MHVTADRLHLSPSDVTAFLACEHLTTLSLAHARGELERPEVENEQAELIFRKGLEHERAYLESLRAEGKTVLEIEDPRGDYEGAARATADAILGGEADVIYQGVLAGDGWRGVADFLLRQPDGTYEALDTKLARSAKPAYILQLLFYNEQLARIQGHEPERIHVLLGSGEQASFRPEEFAAYYRRVRSRLEEFVADPPPTEPYPDLALLDLRVQADLRRALGRGRPSRAASPGFGGRRSRSSPRAGIGTLAQLASAAEEPVPAGFDVDVWERLHEQAEPPAPPARDGRDAAGSSRSRSPSPASRSSPTRLRATSSSTSRGIRSGTRAAGSSTSGGSSTWTASSRRSTRTITPREQLAFETFVDLVHERLARDPDLHVYHYAQYEITALRRLMGRYGTREAELDDLLRRGVFVDLYKVVRNGVRASVPGYGLKELEVFLDFRREAEVKDGGTSIVVFEQWMQTGEQALLDQIDEYNREDCIATRLLRDWLLGLRERALAEFGPFPLPEPKEPKPVPERRAERAALRAELLAAGHELAAQLLDYHDRERKPVWWAFFDRVEKTPEELLEDPDSISGLEQVGERTRVARSWAYTLVLPGAGAQARAGAGDVRSEDPPLAGRDPRARPGGAAARAQAGPLVRGRRRCRRR